MLNWPNSHILFPKTKSIVSLGGTVVFASFLTDFEKEKIEKNREFFYIF